MHYKQTELTALTYRSHCCRSTQAAAYSRLSAQAPGLQADSGQSIDAGGLLPKVRFMNIYNRLSKMSTDEMPKATTFKQSCVSTRVVQSFEPDVL